MLTYALTRLRIAYSPFWLRLLSTASSSRDPSTSQSSEKDLDLEYRSVLVVCLDLWNAVLWNVGFAHEECGRK